ncbi:MAG: sat cysC [Actinomycetia bacterium]|nr:sat cysC [Actinomycetes bacterium]MDQ1653765.1 sulfate adenylyltransferase [Cryptosporangiaceae bacterium]MDQ1659098.1 sulfate adenylyltransferase [Cryptosporangiaceae bacterium]
MQGHLVRPHGEVLVDLVVAADRADELRKLALDQPSWVLTPRQLCDLELLGTGAFSPLRGFLGSADHAAVCAGMRLASGELWPVPITFDVPAEFAATVVVGSDLALRDPEGVLRGVLHVDEVYAPDRTAEALAVYGTADPAHPGVAHLLDPAAGHCLAGILDVVALPEHYDNRELRHTPAQLRAEFARRGLGRVVAFGTRNPMHRAHVELAARAAEQSGGSLLLHPVVGVTAPGDVDHYTRVRCYEAVLPALAGTSPMLSLLPLAMRMAGPREAVLHAIVRQNYGCTHFAVGRDHAGAGGYYAPYAAQHLLASVAGELDIEILPFGELVYSPGRDQYVPAGELGPGDGPAWSISGTEQRRRLANGDPLPAWFTLPEVAAELRRAYPPRSEQGFTILLTGLSGAGKSTVANVLKIKLLEFGGRKVTLLDGDLVRHHLSSELGFSREHRDLNVRRVGFVASEIAKNGGVAVCAMIAPYDAPRREVRRMATDSGGFLLVHVSTGVDVCEQRDRKGLYAKARAGLLPGFTGISDPYETPEDADLSIDTGEHSAEAAADLIVARLRADGYLTGRGHD